MNKTLLVARREFLYNLRRPAFLFAMFGTPLLVLVIMFVSISFASNDSIGADVRIGYVDQSGVLANAASLDDPRYTVFVPYASEDAARAALDADEVSAYMVLAEDYRQNGQINIYNYAPVSDAVRDLISTFLRANLLQGVESTLPLDVVDDPSGELSLHILDSNRTLNSDSVLGLFLVPFLFVMVFMLSTQTVSGFLMSGVVEEKSNRIMEVLVTSITPMQMLAGKILGLGALGLLQILLWIVVGVITISIGSGQASGILSGLEIPVDMLILFVIYFLLTYFLLATLMAGLGAVVGSEQESRQYAGILSLVLVIPFFFFIQILDDPNGSVSVLLTLIPFTAPITVLLRVSLASVPFWQVALSLGILLVTTVMIAWASARIFRWALLRYGKRLRLREVLPVIFRRAPRMETTATQEMKEVTL